MPTTQRRRLVLASLAAPCAFVLPPAGARDGPTGAVILAVRSRAASGSPSGEPTEFDMPMLERLPQRRIVTETPWYQGVRGFTGPLLRDVLAAAGAPSAERARLVALNDYRVEMPLDDVRRYDVIVARLLDDKPMSVREKGPLFVMYPFDTQPQLRTSQNFGRCVWQLKAIDLL